MDGAHVQTTGRSGEGPGEFIYPLNLVALDPDTLVVWDHRTRRLSYFDPNGTFLRSVSIISNFQNPSFVSAFDDGSFLFSDSRPVFPTTGAIEEAPFFVIRLGPDGLLTDSLGVFPGGQMKKSDGPPGFTLVIFSPVTCVSGDRGTFWVSTGKEPEIRERKPNGELVQVVRWHVPDRTVQKEHVEAFFSEQLQDAPTEEIRRRLRQLQAEAPVADEFPVLNQIVVDRVGRIWIRQYRRPMSEGGNPWIIFGRDGELTARVRIPVHIQPRDFGEDYVLGVTKGEYDEEYVVLFEINKSGAGR